MRIIYFLRRILSRRNGRKKTRDETIIARQAATIRRLRREIDSAVSQSSFNKAWAETEQKVCAKSTKRRFVLAAQLERSINGLN